MMMMMTKIMGAAVATTTDRPFLASQDLEKTACSQLEQAVSHSEPILATGDQEINGFCFSQSSSIRVAGRSK